MRTFFLVCLLAVLSGFSVCASTGNVFLSGTTGSSYYGEDLFVLKISNQITQDKEVIAEGKVGKTGNFEVNFTVDTTSTIILSINRVNGLLYIEPNQTYSVTFPDLPSGTFRTFSNTNEIDLLLNNPREDDVNILIARFNLEFDDFLESNQNDMFSLAFKKQLLQFKDESIAKYSLAKKPFLDAYIHYAIANLALNTTFQKKSVYENFILGFPMDLNNRECAQFYAQFFKNEIDNFDVYTKNQPLLQAIENNKINDFLAQLELNPFLENKELREMVAALALWQKYPQRHAKKKNIKVLISALALQSSYGSVKKFCGALLNNLNHLAAGTNAPDFELYNELGNLVSLTSFRENFVILYFWAKWSSVAKNELLVLQNLLKTYNAPLKVITINVDQDPTEVTKLAGQMDDKNQFVFLHYGHQKTMLFDYEVRSIPKIMLLNKKGEIVKNNASLPSEQLFSELDKLTKN